MATQETIKQLNVGGVLRDVEDVTARGLISSLQTALNALTSGDTTTAIESFNEIVAFLENVSDSSTLQGIIAGLNTAIAAKYTKPETGIPASDLAQAVQAILDSVENKANSADVYAKSQTYNKSEVDGLVADAGKVKTITINGQTKTPNETTGDVDLGTIVGQQGPQGEQGPAGPQGNSGVASADGIESVNNLNGGTTDTSSKVYVLGANMGKVIADILDMEETLHIERNLGYQSMSQTYAEPLMVAGGTYTIDVQSDKPINQTLYRLGVKLLGATGTSKMSEKGTVTGTTFVSGNQDFGSDDLSVKHSLVFTPNVDIYAIGCYACQNNGGGTLDTTAKVTYTIHYGEYTTAIDEIKEDMQAIEPLVESNLVDMLGIGDRTVLNKSAQRGNAKPYWAASKEDGSPIMRAGRTYDITLASDISTTGRFQLYVKDDNGQTTSIIEFNPAGTTDPIDYSDGASVLGYTPSEDIVMIYCNNYGGVNESAIFTYSVIAKGVSARLDEMEEEIESLKPSGEAEITGADAALGIKENAVVLDVDDIPCRSVATNTYMWIYTSDVPIMKAGGQYRIRIKSNISYSPSNWKLSACGKDTRLDGAPNSIYSTGLAFSGSDFVDGVEAVYTPSQDLYTIACGYTGTETLPSGKTQMDVFMQYTIETLFVESERINDIEKEVLRLGELATPKAAYRDYYLLGSKNYNYGIYQQPLGIIVMGQSNADGRIPASSLPSTFTIDDGGDTITTQEDLAHCRILQGHKTDNDGSIGSVTNYDYTSADFAGKDISNKKWAFDHIVANAINDALGGNTDFYMVKQTQGDTGITLALANPQLSADIEGLAARGITNSQLLHFRNVYQRALSINPNISFRAVLWNQGGAESRRSLPGEYYDNLCKVIYWVRGVVGNPKLPFIFPTIPSDSGSFNSIVYNDMLRVANDVNDCHIIDLGEADDWIDSVHYGPQTATRLGVEVYKIMRQNNILSPIINPVND